jgi:phosphopantetheinyl transferase (holo-ACP synthase)
LNTWTWKILCCLRAEQSGDKLRRVIDLKRQNALETVYTRWTAKEATQKLRNNKKEIQEKIRNLETKNNTDKEK